MSIIFALLEFQKVRNYRESRESKSSRNYRIITYKIFQDFFPFQLHDSKIVTTNPPCGKFSSVFPGGISAAAQSALSSTIFHEFHHLDRGWTIQGNKFGAGIPIAAVNEGLASVFAEEYTGVYFEAAFSYPENAAEWLEEILALPVDADYSTWMMGEHPDGRNSIGYRVGRYIVHQATANSGKSILELSSLAPKEILRLAETPPVGGNSP